MQSSSQPDLVFYVDECLKSAALTTALRGALLKTEAMQVAPKGTLDEDWLPLVGKVGWVCLSKDRRLIIRPNELAAIVDFKVAMMLFVEANGAEHARMLLAALPLIRRAAKTIPRAFVARVEPRGGLTLLYEGGFKRKRPKAMR